MIGELLASAVVASLITFRKELSGKTDIPAPTFTVELEDEEPQGKPQGQRECVVVERPAHQQDLVRKALAAMESENHKQALSLVERLLTLDQADPFYHLLLGDCYAKLGQVQEALRGYDTVMDYNGKRYFIPDGLRVLAKEQIETLERMQADQGSSKAKKSGGKLRPDPDLHSIMERLGFMHSEMDSKYPKIKALLDRAVALYSNGSFDETLAYATKLTELQPRVGQFHMLRGACKEGIGGNDLLVAVPDFSFLAFREALEAYQAASKRNLPSYLRREVETEIKVLEETCRDYWRRPDDLRQKIQQRAQGRRNQMDYLYALQEYEEEIIRKPSGSGAKPVRQTTRTSSAGASEKKTTQEASDGARYCSKCGATGVALRTRNNRVICEKCYQRPFEGY